MIDRSGSMSSRLPDTPPGWRQSAPLQVQVETWEDGEALTFVMVAQNEVGARAWVVRHDAATESWTGGCANVEPTDGHHDLGAIAAGVRMNGLTAVDRNLLFGASADMKGFAGLATAFVREREEQANKLLVTTPRNFGASAVQAFGRLHRMDAPLLSMQPEVMGLPTRMGGGALGTPETGKRIRAEGKGPAPKGGIDMSRGNAAQGMAALRGHLDAALAAMSARRRPDVERILPPEHWTAQAHAFYACPGRAGVRRRQAGQLYPAFANAIALSPEVAALIDAGRPYEEPLRELLGTGLGEAPTMPVLRRMRTVPAGTDIKTLADAIKVANRLPPDWLPDHPGGWKALAETGGPLVARCSALGVRLADIVAPDREGWLGPVPLPVLHDRVRENGAMLTRAMDMARRFRETLVGQVVNAGGEEPPRGEAERAAGAILFGGKSLAAIERLQAAWHGRLDRFNAALPVSATGHSWPAAFRPFRASNGLEVVCLTDEAQLKAEGGKGPDAAGIGGLDHCVGGYGLDCYSGKAHIASIRRPAGEGFERLSTVELTVPAPGSNAFLGAPEGADAAAPPLFVKQHYGLANGDPADAAEAALNEFMRAIATGAHPIDGEAIVPRDEEGYSDVYDWRAPGKMEAAFEAWAPFLPKGVAAAGLGGMDARIRAARASIADGPLGEREAAVVRHTWARGHHEPPRFVIVDERHVDARLEAIAERRRAAVQELLDEPRAPGM